MLDDEPFRDGRYTTAYLADAATRLPSLRHDRLRRHLAGFAVAASVLDAIARRAAEAVDGVSVLERRLRRRELSIEVDGAALSAALDVSVRYGVPLPAAADEVRRARRARRSRTRPGSRSLGRRRRRGDRVTVSPPSPRAHPAARRAARP